MEEVELNALPQGFSDEGLLFLEDDAVVLLSSFGSKFGELLRFFISWKTTVGWDPVQDLSSVLCDLMRAPCRVPNSAYYISVGGNHTVQMANQSVQR